MGLSHASRLYFVSQSFLRKDLTHTYSCPFFLSSIGHSKSQMLLNLPHFPVSPFALLAPTRARANQHNITTFDKSSIWFVFLCIYIDVICCWHNWIRSLLDVCWKIHIAYVNLLVILEWVQNRVLPFISLVLLFEMRPRSRSRRLLTTRRKRVEFTFDYWVHTI